LRYSTFLGPSDSEECRGLALDGLTAYVGGFTAGTNFPTTASTFDSTLNGTNDGFVAGFGLPATWP